MLFHNGCKSTNLRSTALVALETSVFFKRSMDELLHLITQETHFFAYLVGKCWLFAVHGLEAKSFSAIATRWDKTCACCNSVKGVKGYNWMAHNMEWLAGKLASSTPCNSKCIMEPMTADHWRVTPFQVHEGLRLWVKKTQGDGSYQGHGDWDTDADGLPASGYRSTLPSTPKRWLRFSQSCATAKPETIQIHGTHPEVASGSLHFASGPCPNSTAAGQALRSTKYLQKPHGYAMHSWRLTLRHPSDREKD